MRVNNRDADDLRRLNQPWQVRSFAYYDILGEIKYAAQFYARMLGPLRLFAAEKNELGDLVETDNADAKAALERVQDPGGGRTVMLSQYGRLMFLVGEALLFVTEDEDTGEEQWEMLSTNELRPQSGDFYIRYAAPSLSATEYRSVPADDWKPIDNQRQGVAYRLWKRHPNYSMWPDATMQGVLDLCEELVLLTQAVRSRARSRLAGAGILVIDSAITPPPLEPGKDDDPYEDPLLADIAEAIMTPIADEGSAAAVVPYMLRVSPGDNKKVADMIYHLTTSDPTQLYPETGLRRECIERIAIGLDMPPEILLGMTDANHWCTDEETEILTTEGWKRQDQVEVGDTVLTLNHGTGMSEWKPLQDVARFEVNDLPMRSIETRYHSSLTTMNHRWPILRLRGRAAKWERDWTYSDEMRTTHRLICAAPSAESLTPQWVQHDDALVELVAWLWTEGSVRTRPGRLHPTVRIYQSSTANPDKVLKIRAALTSLYGAGDRVAMPSSRRGTLDPQPRWREIAEKDGMTVFSLNVAAAAPLLNHVSPERIVSTEFVRTLTASQLALFIDTSIQADGSTMRSGCGIISQKEKERLFPFELACVLAGRTPSSYPLTHDGFTRHEQHCVSVSERQTLRLKKSQIGEARYTGIVWCPVTENQTWFARRNGKVYFTGNSGWLIDEQTWKHHGQPIAQQLVDDLSSSYFRPYLRSLGVTDFQKYTIAYDASSIVNHPDKSKDAKDLYDRVAIGKQALRDATGFSEDDAPSESERAERIGVMVRDGSLAWFGTPSVRSGVEVAPGDIVQTGDPGSTGPATGAEVEKGPPSAIPTEEQPPGVASLLNGHGNGNGRGAMIASQLVGASQLALLRAREAAGNKIRSRAKKDPDAFALLTGVRPGMVAAKLGAEKVRELGCGTEAALVSGTKALIEDALHLYGIRGDGVAAQIAAQIEQHVARTLYEEHPAALPPTFDTFVLGLLTPLLR